MNAHTDNASVDGGFDVLDYSYALQDAAYPHAYLRGEHQLWCAVIHQALLDLQDKQHREEARRWLLHNKTDFLRVCSLAGASPTLIRQTALRIYETVDL